MQQEAYVFMRDKDAVIVMGYDEFNTDEYEIFVVSGAQRDELIMTMM